MPAAVGEADRDVADRQSQQVRAGVTQMIAVVVDVDGLREASRHTRIGRRCPAQAPISGRHDVAGDVALAGGTERPVFPQRVLRHRGQRKNRLRKRDPGDQRSNQERVKARFHSDAAALISLSRAPFTYQVASRDALAAAR